MSELRNAAKALLAYYDQADRNDIDFAKGLLIPRMEAVRRALAVDANASETRDHAIAEASARLVGLVESRHLSEFAWRLDCGTASELARHLLAAPAKGGSKAAGDEWTPPSKAEEKGQKP